MNPDDQSLVFSDSHVHLHWYDDVAGLLRRAVAAGVGTVVGVSVDLPSSRSTIDLARRHAMVVAGVGFHPMFFDRDLGAAELDALAELARDPVVGFIGEIGVDTMESTVPLDRQLGVLRDELALARELAKPVNLHLRGEVDAALNAIELAGVPPAGAVFHYFSGDDRLARRAIDLGLYLSVGKPVTRPENVALREAIARAPMGRLLLETDSYPLSGRDTEPADVVEVARAVAELKRRSSLDVGIATTANLKILISR